MANRRSNKNSPSRLVREIATSVYRMYTAKMQYTFLKMLRGATTLHDNQVEVLNSMVALCDRLVESGEASSIRYPFFSREFSEIYAAHTAQQGLLYLPDGSELLIGCSKVGGETTYRISSGGADDVTVTCCGKRRPRITTRVLREFGKIEEDPRGFLFDYKGEIYGHKADQLMQALGSVMQGDGDAVDDFAERWSEYQTTSAAAAEAEAALERARKAAADLASAVKETVPAVSQLRILGVAATEPAPMPAPVVVPEAAPAPAPALVERVQVLGAAKPTVAVDLEALEKMDAEFSAASAPEVICTDRPLPSDTELGGSDPLSILIASIVEDAQRIFGTQGVWAGAHEYKVVSHRLACGIDDTTSASSIIYMIQGNDIPLVQQTYNPTSESELLMMEAYSLFIESGKDTGEDVTIDDRYSIVYEYVDGDKPIMYCTVQDNVLNDRVVIYATDEDVVVPDNKMSLDAVVASISAPQKAQAPEAGIASQA